MVETLFDVPEAAPPRRMAAGVRYVCPECWGKIEVAVPLEEAPLCAACDLRTICEPQGAGPARPVVAGVQLDFSRMME